MLIINCDDFNISQQRNTGITQLLSLKSVSSFSALINFNTPDTLSYHSFGLHLNLTEGKSLQHHSTLTQNHQFLGKHTFYKAYEKGYISNCQIQKQTRAQIDKFIKIYKKLPDHIDGHNHVHMIKGVCELVCRICSQEYGIYKFRVPIEQEQMQQQFLKRVVQYSKQARNVLQQYNIIYPSHFLGLKLTSRFNIQNIQQAFHILNHHHNQFIQLMVHPGYPAKQGHQFDTSNDRLNQLQVLKSKQFKKVISKYKVVSFRQLRSELPLIKKNILILSLWGRGNGNYITSLRYQSILSGLGFKVYMKRIHAQITKQSIVQELLEFCISFRIHIAIGINVYKTGFFLQKLKMQLQIPYILIVSGTDVNIQSKNQDSLQIMADALRNASKVVSLNQIMLATLRKQLQLQLNTVVIQQSIQQTIYVQERAQFLLKKYKLQKKKYCLFTASIRPVKDCLYLINQFEQIQRNTPFKIIHCGPIIDEEYYSKIFQRFSNICRIGVLNYDDYLQLLKNAYCLINSSISEGMNNSILQALSNQVLVFARGNQGNKVLIRDRQTGYIFNSSKQFCTKFTQSMTNNKHLQIIKNGKNDISQRFEYKRQQGQFKQVLEQIQKQFIQIHQYNLIMHIPKCIHPISLPNLRLFQRISIGYYQGSLRVLDIGCGSGIMAILLIRQLQSRNVQIQKVAVMDVERSIEVCAKKNIILNTNVQSQKIKFGMDEQKYDIIVINLPQCPSFNKIRTDKYGGSEGNELNQHYIGVIRQHIHKQSIIFQLVSYLSNTNSYFQKLTQYFQYKVVHTVFHKIQKGEYQQMQPGLVDYLKVLKAKQLINFEQDQDTLIIKTILIQITPK